MTDMVFRCSTAVALALTLTLTACGSNGAETSSAETDGAETSSAETSSAETTGDEAEVATSADDSSDSPAEQSADEPVSGTELLTPTADVLAAFDLEPTPELLDCLSERGVGDELSVEQAFPLAAIMGCVPEEMGAFMADGVVVEGLDAGQVECVVVETARATGGLNAEDARAAFESVSAEIPESVRTAVIDAAPSACDLTVEEVERVLAAQ